MIRQTVPRWPNDRHAKPTYEPSWPCTRTTIRFEQLARYCDIIIELPVPNRARFTEITDFLDAGEDGVRGLYYVAQKNLQAEALYFEFPVQFHFEDEATAMMVKLKWG